MCTFCRVCEMAACLAVVVLIGAPQVATAEENAVVELPQDVAAVWDANAAYRQSTETRERMCINGLWRWQPAADDKGTVPGTGWGFFKVPGCWPGITDYMQKDCQTVYAHPSWKNERLGGTRAAWYQREISLPIEWSNRRVTLGADYVNSFATVFIDGKQVGEIRYPAGELDVTATCRPGQTHVLSMLVVAMPLRGVMLSYRDTASARQVKGQVARRGLCGDVYLSSAPAGPRVGDVKVVTSVRNWSVSVDVALDGLADDATYLLQANFTDGGDIVQRFTSDRFDKNLLKAGRFSAVWPWKPDKLWDVHTPQNIYQLHLSLCDDSGETLDASLPVRVGFREFWIDGRDFYLNGTRIFLSSVPLDNAQVGAAWASYDGARESMQRLASFGINFVYTHNYGCEPGSHLSFEEMLTAADDAGMLISFSQPHFAHYDWDAPDADQTNGYAQHAAFYVRAAQNHPAVVAYSTSHNATGYAEDMNPDMIDGIRDRRNEWSARNVQRALRAEAIITHLDPSRIVYHHASGNLGSMHTSNFYANFAPIQEMSDWFEHWSTQGVKPLFTCEYSVPMPWDWAMYRGWYQGNREFGSATVPWEFCVAEWNAQFFGDRAYQISEAEKANLRWEAERFRTGSLWHRWDYPHQVGSSDFTERYPVYAMYFADNWPAFRTWEVSANSPWNHSHYWTLRPGVDQGRQELKVDWQKLQRPGFSPDYVDSRYETIDLSFERSDWIPTVAAQTLMRNNGPLLGYIAGKPAAFTSKDHNFYPGDTVEKQLIVINNSRETVQCNCKWIFDLPEPVVADKQLAIATGQQERVALRFQLPDQLAPGRYDLRASFQFSGDVKQEDSFSVDVLSRPVPPHVRANLALFDPCGETRQLLNHVGVRFQEVKADADVSGYDVLVVGKNAITVNGPAPDIRRVRNGLKVLLFEQTPDVLEQRFGFRVAEYGLRRVFQRMPDHPALQGIGDEHLCDWRGEAMIVPPRLDYRLSPQLSETPSVRWAGIEVSRLWRCGNRGNVASALIEKPARGDFLPILDGGYSLQYSPLIEYREGQGMVLFCQVDVTGRTENDPAAELLTRNVLEYVDAWTPPQRRKAICVGDPLLKHHLESAGISTHSYEGGRLRTDDVLMVAPGAGQALSEHATAVADFVKRGGHVLVFGLDQQEANTFLPTKVQTNRAEHIAAYFEPPAAKSLLAGICPADVHDAAARTVPLVSGGIRAIGDGILGLAEDAHVVFCQLPLERVNGALGTIPALSISDQDAVDGKQCAVVNMGTVPWAQFGQKLEAGAVGKTFTLEVFVKGLDGPVQTRLEVERAGSPWDRVARGEEVAVSADAWTQLHVTFDVEKPYPEGWSAFLHCGQQGARFRADLFRLYEGSYVPGRASSSGAQTSPIPEDKNLLANASFESGTEPWWFTYRTEQHNLKRTYRRNCFLVSRLLANMGVAGSTPLLERFATPVGGVAEPSVVRNGDFRADTDADDIADEWQFSPGLKEASCAREKVSEDSESWSVVLACPSAQGDKLPSTMLSQHDVPVKKGQWYRISFQARAERLATGGVTMALANTATWRSFFDYQRFEPGPAWERFSFEVQSNDTADSQTRFQIWYSGAGKLWLTDVRMEPIRNPAEGRWLEGFYMDAPAEWDDPYRFFRW